MRPALESVAFSPDGRTLAAGGDDGTISWWDAPARRRLGRRSPPTDGAVQAVAFSPDGTAARQRRRRRHGPALGRRHRPPDRPRRCDFDEPVVVDDVAFSPDGAILAAGGHRRPDVLRGQRARRAGSASGTPGPAARSASRCGLRRQPADAGRGARSERVNPIAFSPDGRHLAAALGDTTVRIWELPGRARGARGSTSPAAKRSRRSRSAPTAGCWPAAAPTRLVRHLGRAHGPASRAAPLGDPLGTMRSVAFSPDGRTLAGGSDDGTVRLWTVADHRPLAVLFRATDRAPAPSPTCPASACPAWRSTPRGGTLASADASGAVQLWAVGRAHAQPGDRRRHRGRVRGVAYPAAGTLAAAGSDGAAAALGHATRSAAGRPRAAAGTVLAVAPSSDGRTLAVAGADGLLQAWDAAHPPPARRRRCRASPATVKAVAFSPDGEHAGRERRRRHRPPLERRAPATGRAAAGRRRRGERARLRPRRHGPRRRRPGRDRPAVGRRRHGRALGQPLRGPAGVLTAVAFSPDGKTLAAAGADKSVWLWDVASPAARSARRSPATPTSCTRSRSAPTAGRSPRRAPTTRCGCGTSPPGRPLGQPLDHGAWVTALAFDPRGTSLASAGNDGTIRLWDPILWSDDRDALERRVCGAIQRSLSRAEWAQFLPGRAYHRTCG